MSIWISNLAASIALAVLAACVAPDGYGTSRSAPVLEGAVNIGVPPGYCIDRSAGRAGRDSVVVLMGRCADNSRAVAALISVSVGRSASGGVMTAGGQTLAAFFTSAPGRATLSREGRASDIRVIEALGAGDAFLLHLADRSVGEHWRAIVSVNGRLITISATGTKAAPLAPADGRKLLDAALAALRRANPPAVG